MTAKDGLQEKEKKTGNGDALYNPSAINEHLACNPQVGQKEKGNRSGNF